MTIQTPTAPVIPAPTSSPSRSGARRRRRLRRPLLVVVVAAFVALPLLWTLSLSFRPESSLLRSTSGLLPTPFTLQNYKNVLFSSLLPRWLLNSIVVATGHVVLVLLLATLAGYAFARLEFPGKRLLFPFALAGMMIPPQVILIPIYLAFADLGWHNSYQALILPGVGTAAPFSLFVMTQFFKAIPRNIEEAARLDGAGDLGVLFRIMLPIGMPALAVVAIIQLTGSWNDFMWPLLSSSKPEWMTLTVGISSMVKTSGGNALLGQTLAAAWSAAIPVVIFFGFFQKRLVRGISLNVESF